MDSIKPKISTQDALLNKSVENLKKNVKNPQKLQQASEDFESLFVYFMLREMRKTVMKSDLLSGGFGGEIMQGIFDQEISNKIAQHSQLGISELLLQQLSEQAANSDLPGLPAIPLPLNKKPIYFKTPKSYPVESPHKKLRPFEHYIKDAASRTGVSADLIRAVIMAESSGNPRAISAKKAKGLMQLMDSTATEVGIRNPFNPRENIFGGAKYLSKMLKKFNGDSQLALAAYNAGPTAVRKHQGIPPFKETKNYVRKVMNLYRQFRDQNKPKEETVL